MSNVDYVPSQLSQFSVRNFNLVSSETDSIQVLKTSIFQYTIAKAFSQNDDTFPSLNQFLTCANYGNLRPPFTRQLCCQQQATKLSQQSCPVDVACCLPLMFGQLCCQKLNMFNFLATFFLLLATSFFVASNGQHATSTRQLCC